MEIINIRDNITLIQERIIDGGTDWNRGRTGPFGEDTSSQGLFTSCSAKTKRRPPPGIRPSKCS